jgi:hypothetical protein
MSVHHLRLTRWLAIIGLAWGLGSGRGAAQLSAPPHPETGYRIRKASGPIVLDGIPDEPDWEQAQVAGAFCQVFPVDTLPACSRTEVRMTYDDQNLYISAICWDDSLPGRYRVPSLRRDFSYPASDAFAVYLDPTADETNGFNFTVSPLGAEREGTLENGGRFGVTTSWDNRWRVKVVRSPEKWTVEMAIPFKTLRYKAGQTQWRVNFSRHNYKLNENTAWVRVPIPYNVATMAFMETLHWDAPPPNPGLNMAFIPYGIAKFSENYAAGTPARWSANGGLDAKVGITPSLNLDLTFNPDFSQVEVDRQVTNLDRFELFFPERRQFFIKNGDLFAGFGFSRIRPFFSRRIGLAGAPGAGLVNVPILAGARLSGKVDQDWRVGLLTLQQEGSAEYGLDGQHYSVAAFQRRIQQRSNVGMIFVNRQGFLANKLDYADYNRVVGVDYNLFSNNARWMGKMFYHQNFRPGQPGDAQATALWLRYVTKKWRAEWNHEYIGSNYRADVGYVPRTGVVRLEPNLEYSLFPNNGVVQRHGFFLYNNLYANKEGEVLDNNILFSFNTTFRNTMFVELGYNEWFTRLTFPFDPTNTGGERLPLGGYQWRTIGLDAGTDVRRNLNALAGALYGTYFNGTRLRYYIEGNLRLQPYANLRLRLEQNRIELPAPWATATLTLLSPEVDVTLRPNLFFTLFVQYNTQVQNVNLNARFQWRFRPMSDLFLVLGENYDSRNLGIRSRGVVLKVNWWLNV